jgi:hypothetical protein
MKCAVCNKKIAITFLGKIVGTYYAKKPVCSECQKLGKDYLKKKLKLKK